MEFKRDPRFGRMIPAMVTPFDADLELDLDRAQELADATRATAAPTPSSSTAPPVRAPTVFYPAEARAVPRRGGAP